MDWLNVGLGFIVVVAVLILILLFDYWKLRYDSISVIEDT